MESGFGGTLTEVLDLTNVEDNLGGLPILNLHQERPRVSVKAGKFRGIEAVVSQNSGVREKWKEWRGICRDAVSVRARAKGKMVEERKWQFDAAISILMGYDTSVIAATSDGKSFVYQILPIVKGGGKALIVGPLLSLVYDQVRSH